jgi:hypothetical protein
MHNSPIPIAEVPDIAPVNYLYRHHLQINLLSQSVQFQEAGEHYQWHSRTSRAQVGLDTCLELAIPWADLQIPPDYSLELLLLLSDDGCYQSFLPENSLIAIAVP